MNVKSLKVILSFAIAFSGTSGSAQINDQTRVKSCLKNEYDSNPDQASCVDIYSPQPGAYHLTTMNKAGHIVSEARITPMVSSNKKEQLIKYEILPLDPNAPITEWKIYDIKNHDVIYSTLKKGDSQFYLDVLLSEHNLVSNGDKMPTACKDAIIFCTVGGVLTGLTLAYGIIAIPGCALEMKKCQKTKDYLGIK